jgi:hypothetical protein
MDESNSAEAESEQTMLRFRAAWAQPVGKS